jgi:hypothetical protein
MAFLSHSENLKGMAMVLVAGTLVVAAGIAALPFGIMVLGGKKKPKANVAASQGTEVVDADEEMTTGDEIVTADSEADEGTEEIAETVDFDSGDLSDAGSTELEDDDLAISDEDMFIEEDEPPKKKRK